MAPAEADMEVREQICADAHKQPHLTFPPRSNNFASDRTACKQIDITQCFSNKSGDIFDA